MVEKVPCKACGVAILPATAEKTGGYCMPCGKYGPPPQKSLVQLKIEESPDHPILEKPWLLDVRSFKCEVSGEDLNLEVELSSHEEYVTLRFSDVTDLKIDHLPVAMKIIHVGKNFPDLKEIRVEGGLDFWARKVEAE